MNKSIRKIFVLSLVSFFILASCNLPLAPKETAITATPAPPTDIPTETPVLVTPTATPIQHRDVPENLPPERVNHAGDYDSSQSANQKQAPGGDRFTFGRFERPFNANTMDVYFPYLDIQDSRYFWDATWVYAVITLKGGDDNQALSGRYAAELDTNLDGGGDWLLLVDSPSSSDWSVNGVQVWFDTNDDVGGTITVNADEHPSNGNGYETKIFDSGQGDDPDLAWARIAPDNPNTVEIAVKRSVLEGDDSFMIGAWAGNSILDPAKFDINDYYTHDEAGEALKDLEYYYPIKAVSELDNTCRVPVGFLPNKVIPGSCPIPPEEQAACPPEYLYCFNFASQTVCYCYAP
jgi:hypothetical protein